MKLSWKEVNRRARHVVSHVLSGKQDYALYGIPRGGVYAALSFLPHGRFCLVDNPEDADVFVDDIRDTGATRQRYREQYPTTPFAVLVDKELEGIKEWVEFPWEVSTDETGPEDNICRILQYIGEDPTREGLQETPKRVVKSYSELFAGYKQDPASVFKVFEDGACDEMVVLKDIEMVSFCEHHMLPFLGQAHVAYIPNGKVIGVSKLARLVDIYSRRLQIQERLTSDITKALDKYLVPKGSACIVKAKHMCMSCRGVGKQHSEMVTSSLTGVFREQGPRSEFLRLLEV